MELRGRKPPSVKNRKSYQWKWRDQQTDTVGTDGFGENSLSWNILGAGGMTILDLPRCRIKTEFTPQLSCLSFEKLLLQCLHSFTSVDPEILLWTELAPVCSQPSMWLLQQSRLLMPFTPLFLLSMIQEATDTECFIFLSSYFPVYCGFIQRKILINKVLEDTPESNGFQYCGQFRDLSWGALKT